MRADVVALLQQTISQQQPLLDEAALIIVTSEHQGEAADILQRWLQEKAQDWLEAQRHQPLQDVFGPLLLWAISQADYAMLARRLRFLISEKKDA